MLYDPFMHFRPRGYNWQLMIAALSYSELILMSNSIWSRQPFIRGLHLITNWWLFEEKKKKKKTKQRTVSILGSLCENYVNYKSNGASYSNLPLKFWNTYPWWRPVYYILRRYGRQLALIVLTVQTIWVLVYESTCYQDQLRTIQSIIMVTVVGFWNLGLLICLLALLVFLFDWLGV